MLLRATQNPMACVLLSGTRDSRLLREGCSCRMGCLYVIW
jgi:hypothetical protein